MAHLNREYSTCAFCDPWQGCGPGTSQEAQRNSFENGRLISSFRHSLPGKLSSLALASSCWCASWFFVAGNWDTQVSQAAKDVAASQDTLVDVFRQVESFLERLETYTHVPLSDEMTDVVVNIMAEVLSILAIATRDIKEGRGSELIPRGRPNLVAYSFSEKFVKKLMGKRDIEDVLGQLDKLTQDEVRMTVAQVLKTTIRVDDKVTAVGCGMQVVDEKADAILDSA